MRQTLAALAAALVAFVAHAAEDDGDFAASKGSAAEAQLHERLKAAIRTIPGTDTQYLIGGYLQLDALATRKKQDGDEQNTFIVSTTPFGPARSDYRLSVRQSQINWLSRTPTSVGDVVTRLEANLFPLDGETAPDAQPALRAVRRLADRRQDLLHLHGRRRAADDARLQRAERRHVRAAMARARLDPVRFRLGAPGRAGGAAGGPQRGRRRVQRPVERAPAGSCSARALRGRLRARATRRALAEHRRHGREPVRDARAARERHRRVAVGLAQCPR